MPYQSPRRRLLLLLGVMAGLTTTGSAACAGKVARVRQEVRDGSPTSAGASNSHAALRGGTSGPVGGLAGQALFYIVLSPWVIPHIVVERGRPANSAAFMRFAHYPYANGASGFLIDDTSSLDLAATPLSPSPWVAADEPTSLAATSGEVDGERLSVKPPDGQVFAARLGLETGVDSGILRSGVFGRIQFPFRLEFDTDWSLYRDADQGHVDTTWLGREHFTMRFAESSAIQFRSGIGPQHLVDASGWVHGLDLTWGFEAFPGRPVVLDVAGSAGVLGKVFAGGIDARVGVMQGPFAVSVGWRDCWFGRLGLHGPFFSVSYWL